MGDKVYKKVEVVGTSSESFSAATRNAVEKACETLHNVDWFEVIESRGRVEKGKIGSYQVTLKVCFRLD